MQNHTQQSSNAQSIVPIYYSPGLLTQSRNISMMTRPQASEPALFRQTLGLVSFCIDMPGYCLHRRNVFHPECEIRIMPMSLAYIIDVDMNAHKQNTEIGFADDVLIAVACCNCMDQNILYTGPCCNETCNACIHLTLFDSRLLESVDREEIEFSLQSQRHLLDTFARQATRQTISPALQSLSSGQCLVFSPLENIFLPCVVLSNIATGFYHSYYRILVEYHADSPLFRPKQSIFTVPTFVLSALDDKEPTSS
jgi:hypothetical protein